jgi:hypothetical protein
LAVVRGDKTRGLAALTFSQGSTGGTLLVAAGGEPWSVTDGGGASEKRRAKRALTSSAAMQPKTDKQDTNGK